MSCGPGWVSEPMLGALREPGNAGAGRGRNGDGAASRPGAAADLRIYDDLSGMTSSRSRRIWSSLGTVGTSRSRNVIGFPSWTARR
jgi:hypothetical protein